MRGRRQERIEAALDRGAAAVLAAAVAFSLVVRLAGTVLTGQLAIAIACAALVAYAITVRLLGRVGAGAAPLPIRVFTPAALEFAEQDELLLTEEVELLLTDQAELVLTDADRLKTAGSPGGELVLDDILAQLGPKARVVRLFDPLAMPTPGQLNARIEQHLHRESSPPAPGDASDALYQALTELRRSLR
jgi:hypothetical protein